MLHCVVCGVVCGAVAHSGDQYDAVCLVCLVSSHISKTYCVGQSPLYFAHSVCGRILEVGGN